MQSRLEIQRVAPQAYRTMAALETYVRNSGLEEALILLVKLRASQINACSYCIDMHTKDARVNGESEQRLYALSAWRETPFFTDRERAALNWTEALTLISQSQAPDSIYEEVRQRFTELELVNLTMTIVTINGWNRICVGFRKVPGTYEPNSKHS
jgi:AhpD family alkylhydroperoxidase